MRRRALVAVLMGLGVVMPAIRSQAAEPAGALDAVHEKAAIADEDRRVIRQWCQAMVTGIVTNQDADRRGMVAAREALMAEGRKEGSRTPAFLQAFGEETMAAVKDGLVKAVGQDARVNLMMVVANLGRIEGVPLLQTAVEKEPYAASRYWAARGLSIAADAVNERALIGIESQMAESIGKCLETEATPAVLSQLFEALGKFNHEKAHEVLADGAARLVQRTSASDPIAVQVMDGAVKALKRAYPIEGQAIIKQKILSALATMCVWVMPPAADPSLLPDLNGALQEITGESVGFNPSEDQPSQKVFLLEWVERFVKRGTIKRPPTPPAVDEAVKQAKLMNTPVN
jgi:hypothetical protein